MKPLKLTRLCLCMCLLGSCGKIYELQIGAASSDASIPTEPWVVQMGAVTSVPIGDATLYDGCYSVAADLAGNVYCAGETEGDLGEAQAGNWDAFLAKFDPAGNVLWVTQLGTLTTYAGGNNTGGDYCVDVAVDSLGNVYCAGGTGGNMAEPNGGGGNDAIVIKLDTNGNLSWVKQLGSTSAPGNPAGNDSCSEVVVDASFNVYCFGTTAGALVEANGGNDIFFAKFDSDGDLLWAKQFGAVTTLPGGSNAGNEYAYSLATDGTHLYASLSTTGAFAEAYAGGGTDMAFLKLGLDGSVVWGKQLGSVSIVPWGAAAGNDYPSGIDVDAQGNSYVAGYTSSSLSEAHAGGYDPFILKLDSLGAVQWLKQYGGTTTFPGGSNAGFGAYNGVAVDGDGNVIASGSTSGALMEAVLGSDLIIAKYDPTGSLLWNRQLGGSTAFTGGNNTGFQSCDGMATDAANNIYCVGTTDGSFAEAYAGNWDFFILKIPSDGTLP